MTRSEEELRVGTERREAGRARLRKFIVSVLHEERAVVQKDVVPKERVRLDKDVTTEQQRVSEEVRKEQIELVDGDGPPPHGIDGLHGTDEGVDRR